MTSPNVRISASEPSPVRRFAESPSRRVAESPCRRRRVAASPCRSHLTSHPRTRKGNTNGKTVEQSRKTPSPSRLSATEEKRSQSYQTLTSDFTTETQRAPRRDLCISFFRLRELCFFVLRL